MLIFCKICFSYSIVMYVFSNYSKNLDIKGYKLPNERCVCVLDVSPTKFQISLTSACYPQCINAELSKNV